MGNIKICNHYTVTPCDLFSPSTLHVYQFIVGRTKLKPPPALDPGYLPHRFQPHPAAPTIPHPLHIPHFLAFLPSSQNTPRAEKVLSLMSFLFKMDLLGAPLEALAFRYSAAVAGSLWAWFAVLATALGLWRICAAIPKPPGPLDPTGAEAVSAPVLIERSPSCNADGIATPKARFMTYFHADDGSDEKEGGDGVSDGDGEETGGEEEEEAPWVWERRIVRNGGDLRWYRYQDDAAFNGTVVRLWDGNVRLTVRAARLRRPT